MAVRAQRLEVSGNLGEYPFPRMLQYLHERRVTGRITLQRGKITKEIFMVEGKAVNVNSNLRDETLGRYLVKSGRISEEEYEKSIQLMVKENLQQGAALVKLGCISAKELYHQVKAQTRLKLLTCFGWPEGEFTFRPAVDFVENIYRFEIQLPSLMHEGINRFLPLELVNRELKASRPGPVLPLPDFADRIPAYDLNEQESAFVLLIDGEKDLSDLLAEQPSFPFAPRLLYLLLLSGLIGAYGEPDSNLRALGPEELTMPAVEDFIIPVIRETAPEVVEQETIVTEPAALSLPEEPHPRKKVRRPPQPPQEESSSASLPTEVPPPRPEPSPAAEEEEEIIVPSAKALLAEAPLEEGPSSPPELRDELEILEFYMVIKNLDFFTLLQINPDASDQDVERAYRALRAKYYRHQFPADLSAEALDKLEEIHAQIIRAYEQLRTAEGRAAYRAELEKKAAPPPLTDPLRAEQFLQRGMAFVRKRDWARAQEMFEEAVKANPTDPEYKGYLGWTVYSNTALDPQERRERAIKLIQEALQLNPHLDSAHVFLGKIWKEAGKVKEAVNEFELALLCNPKCREAERELERHEAGEW